MPYLIAAVVIVAVFALLMLRFISVIVERAVDRAFQRAINNLNKGEIVDPRPQIDRGDDGPA